MYGWTAPLERTLISSAPLVINCDPRLSSTVTSELTARPPMGLELNSAFHVARKLASDALMRSLSLGKRVSRPVARSSENSAPKRRVRDRPTRTPMLPPDCRSTKRLVSTGSNVTIPTPNRTGTAPLRIAAPLPKNHDGTGSIVKPGCWGTSGIDAFDGGIAIVPCAGLVTMSAPPCSSTSQACPANARGVGARVQGTDQPADNVQRRFHGCLPFDSASQASTVAGSSGETTLQVHCRR